MAGTRFRWVIITLDMLTGFIGGGFPATSLPVLFSEISESLNLSLVDIGFIWGLGSLMTVFTVLVGGLLIDAIGLKRSVVGVVFFIGLTGMLRGFATDFWTLLVTSLLFGSAQSMIAVCLLKINLVWFPQERLGFASGMMSVGFAIGLMSGARFSATVLSPALGGWRMVVIATGAVAILVSLIWFIVYPSDEKEMKKTAFKWRILAQNVRYAAVFRYIWILGVIGLGTRGLMRGIVGYIPSYLREIGWTAVDADTALSVFFLSSLICVVPLSMLSDRIHNRRFAMLLATALLTAGTLLLFVADSTTFWVYLAVIIAGSGFDAFMAVHNTMISEMKGVDVSMKGAVIGFGLMLRNVGMVIGPPLGNGMTPIDLKLPFLVWVGFGGLAILLITLFEDNGNKFTAYGASES